MAQKRDRKKLAFLTPLKEVSLLHPSANSGNRPKNEGGGEGRGGLHKLQQSWQSLHGLLMWWWICRDAEKKTPNYPLKAQTIAATPMQPCFARSTLLYHSLYKYTACFLFPMLSWNTPEYNAYPFKLIWPEGKEGGKKTKISLRNTDKRSGLVK